MIDGFKCAPLPRSELPPLLVALIVSAAGLRRAPTAALVCRQWLDVTKRTVASAPALEVFMCVLHDHASAPTAACRMKAPRPRQFRVSLLQVSGAPSAALARVPARLGAAELRVRCVSRRRHRIARHRRRRRVGYTWAWADARDVIDALAESGGVRIVGERISRYQSRTSI